MINIKIFYLLVVTILLSCGKKTEKEASESDVNKIETLNKIQSSDRNEVNTISECSILKNIDSTATLISKSGSKVIMNKSFDDNCILEYVDSISTKLIKSPKEIYFKNLEVLNKASDGYLSEYMSLVAYEQFETNFEVFYHFYTNERSLKMKNFIFDGVIGHIEFSDDKIKAKEEVISLCNSYKTLYDKNELLDELIELLEVLSN